MAEDMLMDLDNSEERCSNWNQGDNVSASKIFNKMGLVRQSKKGKLGHFKKLNKLMWLVINIHCHF